MESVYNYQRVILNAFTEVINRVSMVENYRKSIEIKKQQLESLEASVDSASKLFQNARTEYMEVLFAQRDLLDARMVLIETKKQQLSAIVNAYQALGGGSDLYSIPIPKPLQSHHKKYFWQLYEHEMADRGPGTGSRTGSGGRLFGTAPTSSTDTGCGRHWKGTRFHPRQQREVVWPQSYRHRQREVAWPPV